MFSLNSVVPVKRIILLIILTSVVKANQSTNRNKDNKVFDGIYNRNDYDDDDYVIDNIEDYNTPTNTVSESDYPLGGFTVAGQFGGPLSLREIRRREFSEDISFFIVKDNKLIYTANGTSIESMQSMGCDVNDNFTVIIHGWREQAETEWIPVMVTNFSKFRGGCIAVVDYWFYANGPYLRLVQRYEQIASVIYSKLAMWQQSGLQPSNIHMFGFSFGARLALGIGRRFGSKAIKSIDACDMAGPGFDVKYGNYDYRNSAQNVQCIHTSRDKGTRHFSNCHQNWRIGNCGFSQPGASDPPYGSHGLCPYYYNLAFTHDFMAHKKPSACTARNPARSWPTSFKMGYMEGRKAEVQGELFVPVSADPPFAVPFDQGKEDDNIVMYGVLPTESVDQIRQFRRRRPLIQQLQKIRRNIIDGRRRFTQALIDF